MKTLNPEVTFDFDYLCLLAIREAKKLPELSKKTLCAGATYNDDREFVGILVREDGEK